MVSGLHTSQLTNRVQNKEEVAATALSCCACSSTVVSLVETHYDRHANTLYRLYSCSGCGLVFSEPREAVGADWYEKAVPLEPQKDPKDDARFAEFFRLGLPKGKVLDAGCGEGGFLDLAKSSSWTVVGFDYDPRKVAEVKKRGIDAFAEDWNAFCRSRKDGEFDAVTLFDVLEHTPEPRELVKQASRLLKAGGTLVVTLPNGNRPLPYGREEYDFPPHHFTRWTPKAMRGFLEREGFRVTSQKAGSLEFGYFLEIMTLHWAVKPALKLAKKLLFKKAPEGATVTEIAAEQKLPGALADKGLRSKLFGAFALGSKVVLAPVAGAFWLGYAASRERGNILFTAAVKS
jgi:2-polyprenyl-3-methyl-5-hydroxy-6-metoxy-1,4-benzoquinol methylase